MFDYLGVQFNFMYLILVRLKSLVVLFFSLKGTHYSAQRPRVTKYAVEHIIDFIGRTLTCKSIILRTSQLLS